MPNQRRASPYESTRHIMTAADLVDGGRLGEQQDAEHVFTLCFPSAASPKLHAKQINLPAVAHA